MTTTVTGVRWRDRLAWAICTFALRYIASDWYENFIDSAIRYGCIAAAADARTTASTSTTVEASTEPGTKTTY